MAMNRIQFQSGMSLLERFQQFGTEAQCEAALERARWPEGFRCPRCDGAAHCVLHGSRRKTFQCNACRHQTSVIAGTVFEGTKLGLTVWFLAIYLISEAKTGLSALALKRQLGGSYPTAWLIHHKLMQTMVEREAAYVLGGTVQIDDAYLGGELSHGTAGRGSENKIPLSVRSPLTPTGIRCTRNSTRCRASHARRSRPGPALTSAHRVPLSLMVWPASPPLCQCR
ncbi:IS1595 family transposase [uncultured Thiodictyon sp.]|uniref:IS1595 family transposase n=1 Tax=uncultured Thiodictyon sp. TaxID=1846217 RepID=UPI0025DA9BE9|nr:IS1595 family transposase [uncultured Thiodictyon sp.]